MRWALPALIGLTALRLVVAASVPLVPDEAYYWVWSRALAFGYPDHPPMVALWIRLGTLVAGGSPLGVRLLGPVSAAVSTLLLVDAADRLFPACRPGIRAAILMNATLLFGAGTLLMTPDAPLLAFWIATIWAAARLLDGGSRWWWCAIGLFSGLAMDSKYTALLLWGGIGLWLLVTPSMRPWLRRPVAWLAALLGIGVFIPVLLWEVAHRWPSFTRQGARIGVWHPSRAVGYLAELIGGQVGLITPVIFLLCVAGVVHVARQASRDRDPAATLLTALTVPSVVLFVQHAFGDRVQGNWPAIIYPGAVIAASALPGQKWQRLLLPGIALGFVITGVVYLQAGLDLVRLPIGLDPIARQVAGWDRLAAEVEALRRKEGAQYIVADQYGTVAELAIALPTDIEVVGVGSRWSLFDLPKSELTAKAGILLQSGGGEPGDLWGNPVPIGTVARQHASQTAERFSVYRVTGAAKADDAVLLPRPRSSAE
jgi:4-amino-4-deoxy-L-arabinose transferase-like glycosyltransferase